MNLRTITKKYFWGVVSFLFFIVIFVSFYLSKPIELFFLNEDSDGPLEYSPNIGENSYHLSEEDIRENNQQKMNVMYVKGETGKPIGINMARTQIFPTYYTPGSFHYGASNYVPTYEDAVKLSKIEFE